MKKNNKVESENKENKKSFREKMKDKKYNAKVQLIGYGIFIVILLIYVNVSSNNYNYNYTNKTKDIEIKSITSETITDISLLKQIKNNYHYDLTLTINEDTYTYNGDSVQDLMSINTNNNTYYLKDKEYYKKTDNNIELITSNDIYNNIDYNYLYLDNILDYINKSNLDHTTNYSSGEIVSTYYLYLKDLIPNYLEEDYIEINTKETEDNLNINIDYTNLMKYKNKEINKYIVDVIYTNINKVDIFNIDIKETE